MTRAFGSSVGGRFVSIFCLVCVLVLVGMHLKKDSYGTSVYPLKSREAAIVQDSLDNTSIYRSKSRGAVIFQDQTGSVRIPETEVLDGLDLGDLEELYHRYLESIQTVCHNLIRFGKVKDGGYRVCLDPEVKPSDNCLAYSFGIRGAFHFEDELSKECGCEVHCFDPDDGQIEHQHAEKVFFHTVGIAGNDHTVDGTKPWVLKTVSSIKKQLGHTDRVLELLKIDTEGAEWEALTEMLRTATLREVNQLIIETHLYIQESSKNPIDHRNKAKYLHHLEIFRALYAEGFRIFFHTTTGARAVYTSMNNVYRTGCHEVHFMRV